MLSIGQPIDSLTHLSVIKQNNVKFISNHKACLYIFTLSRVCKFNTFKPSPQRENVHYCMLAPHE